MADPVEDLEEEFEEEEEELIDDGSLAKKTCNIVFIGHVDSGKSTTSGRILYECHMIDDRTMEKNTRESKQKGGESWKYAFAMDELEEERQRGKTWECGHGTFSTETKHWEVIDAPGHRHFIPHMIGGASQADVAVLIISARKGEFETGFDRDGQTREHIVLARTVGVTSLIVAVNKMDDPSVDWDQKRYEEIKSRLAPFLRQSGWKAEELHWLPISGFTGSNLITKDDEHLGWYKGPTLFQILDDIRPPERYMKAPLALSICDKYKSMGNCYILGRIEVGTMKLATDKDKFMIQPLNRNVELVSIVKDRRRVEEAEPGDQLTVGLRGVEDTEIHPGFVLCTRERPVHSTTLFQAQFRIMECKNLISAGYKCIIHTHAATEEAELVKLVNILDNKKQVKQLNPVKAGVNDFITCWFSTQNPVCIEPFNIFPQFGRFIIRDEGRTIGIGVVTNIQTKSKKTAAASSSSDSSSSSSSSSSSEQPSPSSTPTNASTPSSSASPSPSSSSSSSSSSGGVKITMPPQKNAPSASHPQPSGKKPAASPKQASTPKSSSPSPKTASASPKAISIISKPAAPSSASPSSDPAPAHSPAHAQAPAPAAQPLLPMQQQPQPQSQPQPQAQMFQQYQQYPPMMAPPMGGGYPPYPAYGYAPPMAQYGMPGMGPMPIQQPPQQFQQGGAMPLMSQPYPPQTGEQHPEQRSSGLRVTAKAFVPKGK